jgi:hypothetical protein
MDRGPRAWPSRSLCADDKHILRAFAQMAEGQLGPGLATVLPVGIAGRHVRRR